MVFQFLLLLSFGLCLSRKDYTGDAPLPKPSFSAWPSSVVPYKSNVTLKCWTPTRGAKFVLKKGGHILHSLQSPNFAKSQTEIHLSDLHKSCTGEYTCEYYRLLPTYATSQPSDVLLLLVTGDLPKPSFQAYPAYNWTAGKKVTLRCQKPGNIVEYVVFALLKEGTPAPIQHQRPFGDIVEFSLKNVTVNDTGNYSCVYYQTKSPFLVSHPSDSLEIWVTDETEGTSPPKAAGTKLGTHGIVLLVILSLLFLLLSAFFIYKYSRCGRAPDKMTKRPCSSQEPEGVETDASVTMKSCPPASAQSQASNAEESQGVTYAELDTTALRQGSSDLTKQPLETSVYSTVKT